MQENINGHVNSAINFVDTNTDNVYIELGRENAWSNPNLPPQEVDSTTELDSDILFIKATGIYLVSDGGELNDSNQGSDSGNQVVYAHHLWNITTKDNALKTGARYVLVKAVVDPSVLQDVTTSFYQTGVRVGTKFANTIQGNVAYPDYVIDKGTLIAYENHKEMVINNQIKLVIKYLIKF